MKNNTDQTGQAPRQPATGTLGTFAGVFTPSVLTILGIILFLRLGFVVGSAGLKRALFILFLANGISVLTSLSLSAISTNIRVKVGGVYYLISRTLGLEFGGAIGIVMFLAQSISIAFYCIGFGEVLAVIFSAENVKIFSQLVAAVSVLALFAFAWLGADWATRFQYVVMVILGAALVSFFVGGLLNWNTALLLENWSSPEKYTPILGDLRHFFPCGNRIYPGIQHVRRLEGPGKKPAPGHVACRRNLDCRLLQCSRAAGRHAAQHGSDKRLRGHETGVPGRFPDRRGRHRRHPVFGHGLVSGRSTHSPVPCRRSHLSLSGSFFQSLWFRQQPAQSGSSFTGHRFGDDRSGPAQHYRPGGVELFRISYGLLNYATYYEARSASPSFRPRFRWYHSQVSLIGGLACLGVMMTIDVAAAVVSTALLFAVYQYLKRTSGPARWADSQRAYHLQQVREHLLAAGAVPEHPRSWRPHVLLFSDDSHRREKLLDFASWVQGKSGFTTAVRILEGQGVKALKERQVAETELGKDIQEHGISAFPLVVVAPDIRLGVYSLIQSFGVGPLKANTILLNWMEQTPSEDLEGRENRFGRNLRIAYSLGRNIVILDANQNAWETLKEVPPEDRRIDVWWWGTPPAS